MKRAFSLLQSRLHQIVKVFLIGLAVLIIQAFGNGSTIQVLAVDTVKSPEGIYYKGTPDQGINSREMPSRLGEAVRTPEGQYYQAVPDEDMNRYNNIQNENPLVENARRNLQDTADNVREKLNLDEPLPRSTKEFLRSTQKQVEGSVKPLTGEEEGYYQEPPMRRD